MTEEHVNYGINAPREYSSESRFKMLVNAINRHCELYYTHAIFANRVLYIDYLRSKERLQNEAKRIIVDKKTFDKYSKKIKDTQDFTKLIQIVP
jgi:hypothetical protein